VFHRRKEVKQVCNDVGELRNIKSLFWGEYRSLNHITRVYFNIASIRRCTGLHFSDYILQVLTVSVFKNKSLKN